MALWGTRPDKSRRPAHLNPGTGLPPADTLAANPLDRKASFHSSVGDPPGPGPVMFSGRGPGWNVPLEGTDPELGLMEVIACQSKTPGGSFDTPPVEEVSAGNEAPDFFFPKAAAASGLTAKIGSFFKVVVRSVDVENNALVLSTIAKPAWAAFFDNGNGTASYSGTVAGPAGAQTFTARATDTGPLSTDLTFTLAVTV